MDGVRPWFGSVFDVWGPGLGLVFGFATLHSWMCRDVQCCNMVSVSRGFPFKATACILNVVNE